MRRHVFEAYLAEKGDPAWRDRALSVVRELARFQGPDAINGIEPLQVGSDSFGIGVNHQRSVLWIIAGLAGLVLGAFELAAIVASSRDSSFSSAGAREFFASFALPALFLCEAGLSFAGYYFVPEGPSLVLVVDSSGAYLLSRAGLLGFTPRQRMFEWRDARLSLEYEHKKVRARPIHVLRIWHHSYPSRRRRCLSQLKVDPQVFEYWRRFSAHLPPEAA